ncbi:hypothetical protein EII20_13855 [Comamonadaceae bacterium OH2545_COT-014]|nr:hypothetical protein EII20_13855 [Comamonadaceae bacterium OH2545_COT-014]
MQTSYYRARDGWHGRTVIKLPGQRQLVIHTYKPLQGRSLQTSATVWQVDEGGHVRHRMGFGRGGDYSERVAHTQPARITEKQVREQHEQVLSRAQVIVADVNAFYARANTMAQSSQPVAPAAAA